MSQKRLDTYIFTAVSISTSMHSTKSSTFIYSFSTFRQERSDESINLRSDSIACVFSYLNNASGRVARVVGYSQLEKYRVHSGLITIE